MGRLGPLRAASCGRLGGGPARALGLLSSGSWPKDHGTHNAPFFLRLKDYALLVMEKYCVLGPQAWRIVDY